MAAGTERHRNYCWTLNNPGCDLCVEWLAKFAEDTNARYVIAGSEVGESGTPHFQGYIEFKNGRSIKALKKIDKRIHWEVRRGTQAQAITYCKKDGRWFELGEMGKQGDRTDRKSIMSSIKAGASTRDILDEHGDKALRMLKCVEHAQKLYHEEKRNWPMEVKIFWGPTGSGKTRRVYEEYNDVFAKLARS